VDLARIFYRPTKPCEGRRNPEVEISDSLARSGRLSDVGFAAF
jgi:hypothetical protein